MDEDGRNIMTAYLPPRHATIVSCALISLICCSRTPDGLDTVYTDPQYSFRIEAPDTGWIITDATGIHNVLLVIKSNTPVNQFFPNLTISIENLTANITEEEYGKKNQLLLLSQGFAPISSGSVTLHHTRFFEIFCGYTEAGTTMRFKYLCLVRNRIGYTITSIMPAGCSEQMKCDLDTMARSFRFL